MAVALINGVAYSYSQIVINVMNVPLTDVTSINYTEEQEKTNEGGIGELPVSRGRAGITASGSLEIGMTDVEALRDAAPKGKLIKFLPFDILVTYLNAQKIVTHVLTDVEFLDDGVETSHGDTRIARTFNLIIGDIKYR